jgi:hypothetical protein
LWQGVSKYHAKKVVRGGKTFDSAKEARRFGELSLLQKAGEISDLRTQVKYVLIPAQREPDTVGKRGGVIKGRLIERECAYIADFVYKRNGVEIVEDSKGMRTKDYIIKRKLMLWVHGIMIKET